MCVLKGALDLVFFEPMEGNFPDRARTSVVSVPSLRQEREWLAGGLE